MPRPRKLPATRRTETLAIRLSPAERLTVDEAAQAAGLSPSAYARTQLLEGRVIVRHNRRLDPAVLDELRRIGVNLNQLTRLAHQRGHLPPELAAVFAALEEILAREIEHASTAAE